MFSSFLLRKTFLLILVVFLGYAASLYVFSVPLIRGTVYSAEESAAKTILDNVYEIVRSQHLAIEAYRQSALAAHKRELKNITLVQESYLAQKYAQFKEGRLGEAEAKRQALAELRGFRYGNNDYLWVSDYRSVLISHPDPKLNNADFSAVRDVYDNLIVPPMVQVARQNFEGYTSYWWKRLGEDRPIEKLSYSRNFPQWEWVIGTGVYIDDVDAEVARRRDRMLDELRQVLNGVRIARSGYVYIFDSRLRMLVHPNDNLQGTDIASLLDPVTKKSLAEELIAAARRADPRLDYRWDRPDDKGRYVYPKISWVKYFQPFDWYLVSSVYVDELNQSATMLRNRILEVTAVMLVLALAVALVLVNRFLGPVRLLSAVAQRVTGGDLTAHCEVAQQDELGVLARAFNSMVAQLRSSIGDLDRKVRERTEELDEKNARLQAEAAERERMGRELAQSNEQLTAWVQELRQHNREIAILGQMGDMLQACRAMEETFGVITETLEGLFVGESGALFMLDASGHLLEAVAHWGNHEPLDAFPPEACWCFRRGKVHRVEKPGLGQSCSHVRTPPPYGSLCLPLVAQGEVLGMLHHVFGGPDADQSEEENRRRMESRQTLTMTVADHLALALANLKLRDRLRDLSVRDPLTGLFNRRYMEETLEREARRALRHGSPLGVVMLDVDHFKQFNDRHGHDAGDLVLAGVAGVLTRNSRREDVACRYGGEEFILLLPGAGVDRTEQLAETIRRAIEHELHVTYRGQTLQVTVSAGVAVYPVHAGDTASAIQAADTALYEAKRAGRNRVVVSGAVLTVPA